MDQVLLRARLRSASVSAYRHAREISRMIKRIGYALAAFPPLDSSEEVSGQVEEGGGGARGVGGRDCGGIRRRRDAGSLAGLASRFSLLRAETDAPCTRPHVLLRTMRSRLRSHSVGPQYGASTKWRSGRFSSSRNSIGGIPGTPASPTAAPKANLLRLCPRERPVARRERTTRPSLRLECAQVSAARPGTEHFPPLCSRGPRA